MSITAGSPIVPADMSLVLPIGSTLAYAGYTAPAGFLIADGSAVSRTTYSDLFAILCPSATFTVTIATPAVISATAHGLQIGDRIQLTTTGALPTGLTTNTYYYVISAGYGSNAFEVSTVRGGSAVNTSGSQSGTHTFRVVNWGKGDGSTTFNIPDLRERAPAGVGASSFSYSFGTAAVNTGTDVITIDDNEDIYTGTKVQFTTTTTLPAGLSLATDYWLIRLTSTTFSVASTLALAQAGTAIDITSTGTGTHTLTGNLTTRSVVGKTFGEETHAISMTELPSHTHVLDMATSGGAGSDHAGKNNNNTGGSQSTGINAANTGGNNAMNVQGPRVTMNYIIKYIQYA